MNKHSLLTQSTNLSRLHLRCRAALTILAISFLSARCVLAQTPASNRTNDLPPTRKAVRRAHHSGDWNQWGGSPSRNNTPSATGIPTSWKISDTYEQTGEWIQSESEHIKWAIPVGSYTYGNPVVSDGRLLVGTNNASGYLKRYPAEIDLGCLLCFSESDGTLLWQHSSEKLSSGPVHDWPLQGICCTPLVEGNRLWFVTSRGEVLCLDAEGFHDGQDDGQVKNEWGRLFDLEAGKEDGSETLATAISALNRGNLSPMLRERFAQAGMPLPNGSPLPNSISITKPQSGQPWEFKAQVRGKTRMFQLKVQGDVLTAFKRITPADKHEADTVWRFDMMKQLKISQHNMCSCSVTGMGDILFVNTSNGVDESQVDIPSPDAPSFIALDKRTGELLWADNSPGNMILHGQWSSPAAGVLGGVPQVIFAGGDGWVYGFRADRGTNGKPELLWKFDGNPKETKWVPGGSGTRNNIIATPVIHDAKVFVAMGQDPEHGDGQGHLWCIDPTRRGDVSPQLAVKANDHSKILPRNRFQAVDPEKGEAAIDNPNSAVVWHFAKFDRNADGKFDFEEVMHRSLGTVAIKDGLLFIADFSGLFHCLDAKTGKSHWSYDMLAAAWGSPLIVDDHVYIGDEDGDVCVFNMSAEPHEPIHEIYMGRSVFSSPIVANRVLYIANMTHIFAIQKPSQ